AADVDRAAARLTRVFPEMGSARSVQFGPLLGGEEFLRPVPRGALEWRIEFVGPDSLQVRFAPWRFHRRRSLSRGKGGWYRNGGADGGGGNDEGYHRVREAVAHDDLHVSLSKSADL